MSLSCSRRGNRWSKRSSNIIKNIKIVHAVNLRDCEIFITHTHTPQHLGAKNDVSGHELRFLGNAAEGSRSQIQYLNNAIRPIVNTGPAEIQLTPDLDWA